MALTEKKEALPLRNVDVFKIHFKYAYIAVYLLNNAYIFMVTYDECIPKMMIRNSDMELIYTKCIQNIYPRIHLRNVQNGSSCG